MRESDEFFLVEYLNQPSPGLFATNFIVYSEKELRLRLAVLYDWKNFSRGELVCRKYTVLKGSEIKVRESIIGEQFDDILGIELPGGAIQYKFCENPEEILKKTTREKVSDLKKWDIKNK